MRLASKCLIALSAVCGLSAAVFGAHVDFFTAMHPAEGALLFMLLSLVWYIPSSALGSLWLMSFIPMLAAIAIVASAVAGGYIASAAVFSVFVALALGVNVFGAIIDPSN